MADPDHHVIVATEAPPSFAPPTAPATPPGALGRAACRRWSTRRPISARRAAADGLEELRQLHPLHQRVLRPGGGAGRRRLPEGARPPRRPRARPRTSTPCELALYPEGALRGVELAGKDALTLAREGGRPAAPARASSLAPFSLVVPEEPLAREKLFPLLGLSGVDARRGIDARGAMLRIEVLGIAAIHSRDPRTIMAYGAAVQVLRVAVNVGARPAPPGIYEPAPTMTVGWGSSASSSGDSNSSPRYYQPDAGRVQLRPGELFGEFDGLYWWNMASTR